MKTQLIHSILATVMVSFLLNVSTVTQSFAQQTSIAQQLFNAGVKLYEKKQYKQALVNFNEVLKRSPNSVHAKVYVGKCKVAIAHGEEGGKDALKKKLATIIIPSLTFKEAALGDVLDYLSQRAVELTNNKVALNFIYKGTTEQRDNTFVTLNLRNVPMTDAIHYIGQVTHTAMKYEKYAVVADPNGRLTTASAASSNAGEEKQSDGKIFGQDPPKSPFAK